MQVLYSTKSYAKINLSLDVKWPSLSNGYHEISSVFQKISLADDIDFCICSASQMPYVTSNFGTNIAISSTTEDPLASLVESFNIPTKNNLIFKAINCFEEEFGISVLQLLKNKYAFTDKIILNVIQTKRIPIGAGLGGGSSNAASTIEFCRDLLDSNQFSQSEINNKILNIAPKIGADVAFFLKSSCALMQGIGERLINKLGSIPFPIILLGCKDNISTKNIYDEFDKNPSVFTASKKLEDLLMDYTFQRINKDKLALSLPFAVKNNLSPTVESLYPNITNILEKIRKSQACICAELSGTGSTCFAICKDEENTTRLLQKAKDYCDWVYVC